MDNLNVQGYQVFSNNRTAISRYRSGGITLMVKNELSPFITVCKFESKLILWFSVSKQLISNDDDLYCGIVYIQPYRSKFAAHADPFLELQNEIDKYMSKSKNILLFGDFNSRSGTNSDIVKCDKFISELQGTEELYTENLSILNYFDECNIPLQRNSADKNLNFYGPQLLELCKYNNIFILNGRLRTDKTLPKTTCKNRSTIDYFISAVYNFPLIHSFDVFEFESLYSDAHCAVMLSINILPNSIKIGPQQVYDPNPKPRLWDDRKGALFVENLNENELQNIKASLATLTPQTVS